MVLADRVIECGWVAVSDGIIVEIGEGAAPERGEVDAEVLAAHLATSFEAGVSWRAG